MGRFTKKNGKGAVLILVTVVSILLLVSAVSMLVQYTGEVSDQATTKAAYKTLSVKEGLLSDLYEYETRAVVIGTKMSMLSDRDAVYTYIRDLILGEYEDFQEILTVRYFHNGELYDEFGNLYEATDDIARDFYRNTPLDRGYIGTYNDTSQTDSTMSIVGFYTPVKDSPLMEAVVIYYDRSVLENFMGDNARNEDAEFSLLCTPEGEILVRMYGEVEINQAFELIRSYSGDKTPEDDVKDLVSTKKDGIVALNYQGDDYLVSVCNDAATMKDLSIIEMYKVDVLSASTFDFIHTIIAIFILFAVIVLIVITYLIVHRIRLQRDLYNMETIDIRLGCHNRHGFEKEAEKILERNHGSYFAVVVMQLRHYKFLVDSFGNAEADALLSHLRLVLHKNVILEETFGHNGSGQFLVLLHAKDQAALLERLKILSFLSGQYKRSQSFDILIRYGIYEVDLTDKSIAVPQMVDFAIEANNAITKATAQNATMQYNFYSDELRKLRLLNEDMELRMEGALQNGEFQVFYQPKYSLRNGRQDGAEALVRWYDAKTNEYNRPALFMQLFETNGFIVKLDKYIYSKVCEYISYSIAQGRPVFPVSVNVSRITAVQPDFIEYYSKIKKQYGISNDQIMIEFTESFAYENYETLRGIVDELHKNGFKCSIDDFGCGYSTYRILKSLRMDEIKLDKFFLDPSDSAEKDTFIFESIIWLAKKLKMKVTQEGVETFEDVVRLRDMGCDVIQGYYYAKPLSLSDYIAFCAATREHNIELPPKTVAEPDIAKEV